MKIVFTTAIVVIVLLAHSISQAAAEPKSSAGRDLYTQYCSSCHGLNLQGGNAKSLVDKVWQFGDSRRQIIKNTKFGLPHLGMPAYEKTLTDLQITQILDYLKEAESYYAVVKPGTPDQLKTLDYNINVEIFASGLEVPWSIDFPDSRSVLITERPGRLRLVTDGKLDARPIANTPKVLNEGQGGLMDVAINPEYAQNGWIYLAYSHALEKSGQKRPPAMTRIVRGRIKDHTWTDQQVIYEAPHDTYRTTRIHYGCRIVFDRDGTLYFGIGDRGIMQQAQQFDLPNGKIHRINRDGTVPKDNPFVKKSEALPTIYTYGNRNPQGLAIHPATGQLWQTEHGPLGGDELNLMLPGVNYGWPVITYGKNYNGTIISELEEKSGMAQPIWYWTPSIAVCGLDFCRGEMFKKWKNHLLVGALKYEQVSLLDIKDNRVLHEEVILKNAGRVRDVACGPDGAIYVVLNSPDIVLRLTPMQK